MEMLYGWLKLSEWKWKRQNVCQCVRLNRIIFFINVAYRSPSNRYCTQTKAKQLSINTIVVVWVCRSYSHIFIMSQYRLLSRFAFLCRASMRLLASVLCICSCTEWNPVHLEVVCWLNSHSSIMIRQTNFLLSIV